VEDLMLRDDLVEAVARKQFRILTVSSVAEGIELLTGVPAGERHADGKFDAASVFGLVDAKLHHMAQTMQNFDR
jgi:hypothetical protein